MSEQAHCQTRKNICNWHPKYKAPYAITFLELLIYSIAIFFIQKVLFRRPVTPKMKSDSVFKLKPVSFYQDFIIYTNYITASSDTKNILSKIYGKRL